MKNINISIVKLISILISYSFGMDNNILSQFSDYIITTIGIYHILYAHKNITYIVLNFQHKLSFTCK